jgi:predicted site-specific integrase-resolvase
MAKPSGSVVVWLSMDNVCLELGVNRSTMDLWRSSGRAPRFTKLPNGQLRVRREWLDEWLLTLPDV